MSNLNWYYHVTFPETNMMNVLSKHKQEIAKMKDIPILCPRSQSNNYKILQIQDLKLENNSVSKNQNLKLCRLKNKDPHQSNQTNRYIKDSKNNTHKYNDIIYLIEQDDDCGDNSQNHISNLNQHCEIKQNDKQVSIRSTEKIQLVEIFKKHRRIKTNLWLMDENNVVTKINLFDRQLARIHVDESKFNRIIRTINQKILGNKLSYQHEFQVKKSFATSNLINGDYNDQIRSLLNSSNESQSKSDMEINTNSEKAFITGQNILKKYSGDQLWSLSTQKSEIKSKISDQSNYRFKSQLILNRKNRLFTTIIPDKDDLKKFNEFCFVSSRDNDHVYQLYVIEINIDYHPTLKFQLQLDNSGKCIVKTDNKTLEFNTEIDIKSKSLNLISNKIEEHKDINDISYYGIQFKRQTTKNVIKSKKQEFYPPESYLRIQNLHVFEITDMNFLKSVNKQDIRRQMDTIVSRINIDQNYNSNSPIYYNSENNIEPDSYSDQNNDTIPDTIAAIQYLKWDIDPETNDLKFNANQLEMAFFSQSQQQQYNLYFKMINVQTKNINEVQSPTDESTDTRIDMMQETDLCYDCQMKNGADQVEVRQCEGVCYQ